VKKIIKLSGAGEKFPRCRLCDGIFEKHFDAERGVFIYACRLDQVAIRLDDIMLKPGAMARAEQDLRKGEDTKELFDCGNCRAAIRRFFATSTGYMKFKCTARGCGMTAELKEPDRTKPDDIGVGLKDLVLDLTAEEKERFS